MPGGLIPPVELLAEWATDREKFPYGERRSPFLIVLISILLALTLVAVGARLWARCRIRRNAGLDDLLIVIALPFLVGHDACQILGFYYYAIDRHTWEATYDQGVKIRIITLVISFCYILVTSLVKISILRFYRRLGDGAMTTTWLWTLRGSIIFVALYAFIFILMGFVACTPMDAFWNMMDPDWVYSHDFTCFDEGADFISSTSISVVEDTVVCVLPLIVVSRLQMPRKQKLALAAIFGVGFFLCFCGIMRVYYMYRVYYQTYDSTWEALPVWYWTTVEIHFAIICASAPALKMFFRRALQPSTDDETYSTRRQRHGYDNFGSGGRRTHSTKDDADISMEDMLAYDEANVGTATAFAGPEEGGKPPTCITVTRGVDVTFSRDSGAMSSDANTCREDAASKKSIGPKASSESLLDNPFSGKKKSSF